MELYTAMGKGVGEGSAFPREQYCNGTGYYKIQGAKIRFGIKYNFHCSLKKL